MIHINGISLTLMDLVYTTYSFWPPQSFDPNGPGLQFQVFTQHQLRLLGDRQGADSQAGVDSR